MRRGGTTLSEVTLALTKDELEGAIGFFFGFGRGAANDETAWSSKQDAMINAARRSGLRAFYTASAGQDDGSSGYEWSFLRPLVSLSLPSGQNVVPLPEDYHGLEGRITASSSTTQVYRPIPVVGIGQVQESYARTPTLTGWPQLCAIQPLKQSTGIKGQRFQLYFFPTSDQAYTLQFTYWLSTNDLDTARPYPYGGAQHSETIKAACLAAAEQDMDNEAGVQTQRFQQMLLGSIAVDRRNKPQLTGYCGDRSDARNAYWYDPRRDIYDNTAVTFDGTSY